MLPPMGAIIIGPCPECKGLVVVFCGHVLPLQNEIMLNGSLPDKHEHLMTVLMDFLSARIDKLLQDDAEPQGPPRAEETPEENGEAPDLPRTLHSADARPGATITKDELDTFRNVDLKLLDDKDYFRAVFS